MNDNPTLPEREQEILDTALLESDQLLARSLHDDELRRRRRWLVALSVIVGGAAMFSVLLTLLFGGVGFLAVESHAVADDIDHDEWRARLTEPGEDARWFVGANLGKELSALPGDAAYEILQENWREIADAVRPQILKGFTPGIKKSPGINDGFFRVMHLGLREKNEQVSEFARTYINQVTISNIADDKAAYEKWRRSWREQPARDIAISYAKEQLERFRAATPEQIPAAMALIADAANDLREFAALRKAVLEAGLYDIVDGWVAAGNIQADDISQLLANVPRPDGAAAPEIADANNTSPGTFQEGWQLFFQGRYHTAERIFRALYEADPEDPDVMNGLGWAVLNQGRHEEAKPLFEACLKKQPNAGGAMNGLAICLKKEGKVDEAIKLWLKLVKDAEVPNAGHSGLAATYMERKEYAKAVPLLEMLVEAQPDNEHLQTQLDKARRLVSEAEES